MINNEISIGILILDSQFPRIPGDIGYAGTWDFPVHYHRVHQATPDRIVKNPSAQDEKSPLHRAFMEGAQQLVEKGVAGIVSSCGFLTLLQEDLQASVPVPVMTSALMQIPLVMKILPKGTKPGILTISAESLTPDHLRLAGVETGLPTEAPDPTSDFVRSILGNLPQMDIDQARAENIKTARRLCHNHPDVGAIVLECTNMAPYAAAIQQATGRPVFSAVTMVNWLYSSLSSPSFSPSPHFP